MTKKELAQEFLDRYHMTISEGSGAEFLLPYLIMDIVYSEYRRNIRPASTHNLRQISNEWARAYSSFNKNFFGHFKPESVDAIIDLMDGLDEYVKQDITILKIQLSNLVNDIPFEEQMILSSAFLCNVLCQAAQSSTTLVYKKVLERDAYNPQIEHIQKCSLRWAKEYYKNRGKKEVNLGSSQQVLTATGVLCRKLVKFIEDD